MITEIASNGYFPENFNETTPALSRRGLEKHKTNPFLPNAAENTSEGFKRRSLKSADGKHLMITNSSGENVGPAGFWHTQEVDKTQFIKLYVNGVKAFAKLSGAGAQVFGLIYAELQASPGKDIIHLNFLDLEEVVLSKATFMRGIRNLLDKKFLAETLVSGRYFVNPDFIFNGDRLAMVKDFRLKRDKADDDNWEANVRQARKKQDAQPEQISSSKSGA